MTKAQKTVIQQLRNAGKSYADISRATKVPIGTIKAFCSRNMGYDRQEGTQRCNYCNKEIPDTPPYRKRRFCSDQCRYRWWGANRNRRANGSGSKVCLNCKSQYVSYDPASKYCSHACYIAQRFGKGKSKGNSKR